jgi:eukaryotic-like serine/threonine-protein kinase
MRRAGIIAVPAFLLGYLVTAIIFFGGGPRGQVITVPDLRTLTAARARRLVERAALEFEVTDSLPNARVARGAVVAQTPLPGREVAPETPVRVILSQGREQRVVPRVDTYPRRQAERILVASGFRVVVYAVPHARRAGRVVGTQPAAGGTVQMPGTVRLLISAGPPLVAVPQLVGLLRPDAEGALQQAGLRMGDVVPEVRPELAEGVVLSQYPAPGDSIRAGSTVDLNVATQTPPTDIEGLLKGEELPAAPPEASGSQ